jgi:DnaK suppressor protein
MPRAKQQDPVEAQEADGAVHARANGASRTAKGPATAAKGTDKPESKPTNKAPSKAHDGPGNTATPGQAAAGGKSEAATPVAKRAAGKEANGAPAVAPKTEAGLRATTSAKAEPSAKADKAKPVKAVSAQKASKPAGQLAHQDMDGSDDEPREVFLDHQRVLLIAERNNYTRQAEELRAQAEALALEHEPGDVQFDEEGGEGGTANVDRELDLHLSAQAHAAIEEIDAALVKIGEGTYGFCESCGNPVPKARLEALPHARLCVSCKSGGLSARRQ